MFFIEFLSILVIVFKTDINFWYLIRVTFILYTDKKSKFSLAFSIVTLILTLSIETFIMTLLINTSSGLESEILNDNVD